MQTHAGRLSPRSRGAGRRPPWRKLPLLGRGTAGVTGAGPRLSAAPSGRAESWDLWPFCAGSPPELGFRGLHFPGCIGEGGRLSLERRGRPRSPGASSPLPSAVIAPSNPPPGGTESGSGAPPPEPGLEEEPVSRAPSDEAHPRERGRGGQAEDFARPRRPRLGAEVRGGERGDAPRARLRGCGSPAQRRGGGARGPGRARGPHPWDPRGDAGARACVGGLAVPAPRRAGGGSLEPAGPRSCSWRRPSCGGGARFLPLVNYLVFSSPRAS